MSETNADSNKRRGLVGSSLLFGGLALGIIALLEVSNPVGNFIHSYSPALANSALVGTDSDSVYLQRAQALAAAGSDVAFEGVLNQYVCDTWLADEEGIPREFDVSSNSFLSEMVGSVGVAYLDSTGSLSGVKDRMNGALGSGFTSSQGTLFGWEMDSDYECGNGVSGGRSE